MLDICHVGTVGHHLRSALEVRTSRPVGVALMLGSIAGVMIPWTIWGALKVGGFIGREIGVASTPIPSPDEIAHQLAVERGRPATVLEVAAVHQMLTDRKNQALLNVVGLGALYLIHRSK